MGSQDGGAATAATRRATRARALCGLPTGAADPEPAHSRREVRRRVVGTRCAAASQRTKRRAVVRRRGSTFTGDCPPTRPAKA